MSCLKVKFLKKEYSIPEDVLTYIELLTFTDSIQKQLTTTFVRKLNNIIQQGETGLLGDKDMAADIEYQVGRFISKLTEKGIYDRTVNDYLCKNEGYKLISKVNADALDEAKRSLKQQMSDWLEGYENAIQKKEASVTGLGFSIWSGSFVNHAIYAAMEASKLHEQEQAAVKQYQKDMDELDARIESKKNADEKWYISNTYIPHMEAAITVLSYELLDTYISDLINYGKLNKDVLNYIHIDRSNDLLKNLELSQNKEVILLKAFEACPYNIAVYMQAMKYDLLDYESFQTAKLFGHGDTIVSFLEENLGSSPNSEKRQLNFKTAELLSLYTDTSLRDVTAYMADYIVNGYSQTIVALSNESQCRNIMSKVDENDILTGDHITKEKVNWLVDPIAPAILWNKLTTEYGHEDLFERLLGLLPEDVNATNKQEYDAYLKEKLFSVLEGVRLELVKEILARKNEEQRQRELEAERARIKAEKRKKILKLGVIITAVLILILIAVSIINKISNSKAYKQMNGEYCVYQVIGDDGEKKDEYNWWLSIEEDGAIKLTSWSYAIDNCEVNSYSGTLKNKANFRKLQNYNIEDFCADVSEYESALYCYEFNIADEWDEFSGYIICWQYRNGKVVDVYCDDIRYSFVETGTEYNFSEWVDEIDSDGVDDDVQKLIEGIDTIIFDDISIENINYATAFLGKKTDENGNIDVSDNDYTFLNNDATLLDIPGRFSHAFSPTGTDNKTIDMMDWVSNKKVQNFEDIVGALKILYGGDCRIQHYNDAAGDAYMWKNAAIYEYVICWQNADGTVNIRWTIHITDFANCSEGDVVQLGKYEQDGNTKNGKENIDWIVLKVQDGKAFVISKYALDTQSYNKHSDDVTWESCSLRAWLNKGFIDSAFSSAEKDMILNINVSADKNPVYVDDVDAGKSTSDKVFLLSIDEAKAYFPSMDERKCEPTSYVSSKLDFGWDGYTHWWLRTPGEEQNKAAYISAYDDIVFSGDLVFSSHIAVRPAMWIEINS